MSRKLTLEECKEKLKYINSNLKILSKEYINSKEKLEIVCLKCNNVFHSIWANRTKKNNTKND